MSRTIDESPKAPFSERFRAWWFKGVDTGPPRPSSELSYAMRSHIEGMTKHASDIQGAAVRDGARIRRGALDSTSKVFSYVEYLETALVRTETEYGKVLQAVRAELADLRTHLEREQAAAQASERAQSQPLPTPANGSGVAAAA
jgi:hypothetical protein